MFNGAGLQQLEITKPYTFCDRGYSQLSSLQDLTSLELGHSWMLGAGPEPLDFLNSMTLLQKLSITKCFVRDEDLRPIRQLVDLQLLGLCEANRLSGENCFRCKLSARTLRSNVSLCKVESIKINRDVSIQFLHFVSNRTWKPDMIQSFKDLFVGTVFEHLTGLTKLEGLTLEGSNQMTDEGVACVAMLTTLKQLHLVRFKLGPTPFTVHLSTLHLLHPCQCIAFGWPFLGYNHQQQDFELIRHYRS